MKRALITGINGQDGSYLAEFLVDKGYEVWGTLKRNSVAENQTARLESIFQNIRLEYADITDLSSLIRVVSVIQPDEIYNLAAQSHVRISFDQPIYTAMSTGLGALNVLEAVKLVSSKTKIYQASSSEMFGNSIDVDGYQRETTSMNPVSPYGCAKVYAYNISRNYRHSYDMFVSNGILFNHDKAFIYESRGYKNRYEHNDALIAKINEVVRPEDTLIHLGDFCLNITPPEFESFSKEPYTGCFYSRNCTK